MTSDQLSTDYPQADNESDAQYAARLDAYRRIASPANPDEYMAAGHAAGLTGAAQQAAAGGAAPVQAPSFDQQLAQYQQRNAALEAQIAQLGQQFAGQLAQLQAALGQVRDSVPAKVDPVTESAAKVARAFADVALSDARTILASALHSHLVSLGLEDLAKLI